MKNKKKIRKLRPRPSPVYASMGKKSYEMRLEGFTYKEIGKKHFGQYTHPRRTASRYAEKYAYIAGKDFPIDTKGKKLIKHSSAKKKRIRLGKKSYEMRLQGFTYTQIGKKHFKKFAHPNAAAQSHAKKYTIALDKDWPVKKGGKKEISKGEQCYLLRSQGFSFKDISLQVYGVIGKEAAAERITASYRKSKKSKESKEAIEKPEKFLKWQRNAPTQMRLGKQSYEMKLSGKKWLEIGKKLFGLYSWPSRVAKIYAKFYVLRSDKEWPIKAKRNKN